MNNKTDFNRNIVISLAGNLFLILLGIIVPRITILSYGSDINGLLHTVSQIFVYLALMEGGIGQAAKNLMYKPIAENNKQGISWAVSVASHYYKRITRYYAAGVVLLSLVCPLILKTNVDRLTVFTIIILEGLSGVVSFYFTSTYTYFLSAYGKSYVNQSTNVVVSVIGYIVKIVLAVNGINIIALQASYCVFKIGLAVFYHFYFKKNFAWLDLEAAPKNAKLKDRNYYIITEISWLAYSSTDMIVLSTFLGTVYSSIYAVYTLAFNCINTVMNALYHSVNFKLSRSFHEDKIKYMRLHDVYTSAFFGGITALLCTAYLLLIPFIRLYVGDVTDAQYVNSQLPLFFCLIQLLTWSRYVMGNLSGLAGYAKQASYISIVEAGINIILSVVLVNKFKIVGVLIGSVVALPVKIIYLIWLCERKILNRSPIKYICILAVNFGLFAVTVYLNQFIKLPIGNYFDFIFYGVVVVLICTVISAVINTAVNPDCFLGVRQFFCARKDSNERLSGNRFTYIDSLKLLCAFLVVCIHAEFSWDGGYVKAIASVAVPIFFMITGFFYSEIEKSGRQRKQIMKTLILLVVSNMFYLLWRVVIHLLHHDLIEYLSGIFTPRKAFEFFVFNESPFSIHLWYLGALLYLLLIAQRLSTARLRRLYILIPILLGCGIILGKYSPVIFGKYFNYLYSRNFLFDGLPFFLLGVLTKDRLPEIKAYVHAHRQSVLTLCVAFVATILAERYLLSGYKIHGDVFIATPFFASMLFILAAATGNGGKRSIISRWGAEASAFIYVTHLFVKDFVALFIPTHLTDEYYLIRPIVVFGISLILAFAFNFALKTFKDRRSASDN